MNSLNLRQIDGGNVIKQADFGSNLSFELLDERRKKIPELDGQTATIRLIKGDNIAYQTESLIVDGTVSFKFDRVLEKGIYVLEIAAGNYVFPSNNMVKITVEKTAGNYKPENMVKTDLVELQGKITAIEQREHDVNQELLDVEQKQSEMTKRIEILEQKEDHDTIYDDTEIKQSIANFDNKMSRLSEKVTALEERPIVDAALTERVEALERKEDKDTIYDDSNLKSQIVELESKLQSLNTVRRAPTGYTLDRTTTPWTIWFDNGCGLQMPDYSPKDEQVQNSTIYGFGFSLNIMNTTVGTYPVPQNFIAASMGHISLNNFSKQDANAFIYFSPSTKVINPVRNDAENFDWSHCYGEVNEDNNAYKRKHVFPRVCYELGIWSEADVLYLGATKK